MANLHARFVISIESRDEFSPQIEQAIEALEGTLIDSLKEFESQQPSITARLETA